MDHRPRIAQQTTNHQKAANTPKPADQAGLPPQRDLSAETILRLQRTVGNRAAQRLIETSFVQRQLGRAARNAPKKPTKIQQKAAPDVVQRAVGFEFQTNWGIVEKVPKKGAFGRTKSEYRPFNKGETLHHYQGYKLTADEAGTELGAEIEWVVDPPLPDSLPINQVDQLMQSLENLVAQFVALQNQDRFMLDSITGDPRDATIEVRPKIKSAANAQNMKANPQVTGGIRLDQMQTLFKQLGQPNTADPQHQHVLGLLTGMGGAGLMGSSGAAADAVGGSDKLKGLATQLIAYLKAGSDPLIQTMGFSAGRAFDYAKLIGKLMARTDFASQFKMLDPQERQPFEQNPQTFVDLILNAAGMTGTDNTLVFERAIKNQAGDPSKGVFNFPVTRKDWLWMIVQGTDQLSSKAMPQWKDELEGLGALGGKTDSLASGERGVVAEFRTVQQQMPYTQWRQFAIDVFAYLAQLNSASPEENERAALFSELPQSY
ncbi:hypothetical protein VZO05_11895 [Aggregatilineales bacterium SYSU G02658]